MYIQSLQPTLIKHNSTLNVVANTANNILVKVLDTNGNIAKTIEKAVNEGRQELSLNLSDLAKGNYVLNAFTNGIFLKSIRFVKH